MNVVLRGSPELGHLCVWIQFLYDYYQTPIPLEGFGLKSFGTSQCCLPCQHPVIEFGPTSDDGSYAVSSGPTANRVR